MPQLILLIQLNNQLKPLLVHNIVNLYLFGTNIHQQTMTGQRKPKTPTQRFSLLQ